MVNTETDFMDDSLVLSELSYDDAAIEQYAIDRGLKFHKIEDNRPGKEGGLNGYLLSDGKNIHIVYRGSQETQDWQDNVVSHGYDQFSGNYENNSLFIQNYIEENDITKVSISGHSLGGGIAQYQTYDLVESGKVHPRNINLTTYNSLGGEAGLVGHLEDYDPNLLDNVNGHHYRHPKDPVSLMSDHVGGESYDIVVQSYDENGVLIDDHYNDDLITAHGLDYFKTEKEGEAERVSLARKNPNDDDFDVGHVDWDRKNDAQTKLDTTREHYEDVREKHKNGKAADEDLNLAKDNLNQAQKEYFKETVDFYTDLFEEGYDLYKWGTHIWEEAKDSAVNIFLDTAEELGYEEFAAWVQWFLDVKEQIERFEDRGTVLHGPVENVYLNFIQPAPSPLVLDLDGDGIELTPLDGSSTYFDLNINGFAELTGWVSPDDALLALDVNGDGIINDGSELFGDQTGHDHGFLALDVNGINVNRMPARAFNLNAANDTQSPSIKPAA